MSCCVSRNTGKEVKFELIDRIIKNMMTGRGVDSNTAPDPGKFGYLPEDVQAYIAERLKVPLSEFTRVVFTRFSQ